MPVLYWAQNLTSSEKLSQVAEHRLWGKRKIIIRCNIRSGTGCFFVKYMAQNNYILA